MESKINNLSICYTLFLILLFLQGFLPEELNVVVQCFAYIIPFALGLYFMREDDPYKTNYLLLRGDRIRLMIPLIFPTVLLVMGLSALNAVVIKFLSGAENNMNIGDQLIPALISNALIPAIFEELLFRYLPMRMLKNHSGLIVILVSSASFALIHHSFFYIPYAFVAGVIFMAVDLMCESIVPSFLLHLVNNVISVGMLIYKDNRLFVIMVCAVVSVLALISLIYIGFNRKEYMQGFFTLIKRKEKVVLTTPAVAFCVACLVIALVSII